MGGRRQACGPASRHLLPVAGSAVEHAVHRAQILALVRVQRFSDMRNVANLDAVARPVRCSGTTGCVRQAAVVVVVGVVVRWARARARCSPAAARIAYRPSRPSACPQCRKRCACAASPDAGTAAGRRRQSPKRRRQHRQPPRAAAAEAASPPSVHRPRSWRSTLLRVVCRSASGGPVRELLLLTAALVCVCVCACVCDRARIRYTGARRGV